MLNFDRQVVMLTGAAGHLGREVACAFADRGAQLVLLDHAPERIDGFVRAHLPTALVLRAQLAHPSEAQHAVADAIGRLGRIDVLCNLAGGFRMGEAVHETTTDTWNLMLDTNVRTLLHMTQAVVPAMLRAGEGRIVNVGALSSQRATARMGAYAASKTAVLRLTESMSDELRERGINVNCVLPSVLDTPRNRADMPDADPRRWVRCGDLAHAIVFLASKEARAIHGAALPVRGLQ